MEMMSVWNLQGSVAMLVLLHVFLILSVSFCGHICEGGVRYDSIGFFFSFLGLSEIVNVKGLPYCSP